MEGSLDYLQVWGPDDPANSENWCWTTFCKLAPKLGAKHYLYHCILNAVVYWESKIQGRRNAKSGCCGFEYWDSKNASFHLVAEILNKNFKRFKCARCLAVSEIIYEKDGAQESVNIACLCKL